MSWQLLVSLLRICSNLIAKLRISLYSHRHCNGLTEVVSRLALWTNPIAFFHPVLDLFWPRRRTVFTCRSMSEVQKSAAWTDPISSLDNDPFVISRFLTSKAFCIVSEIVMPLTTFPISGEHLVPIFVAKRPPFGICIYNS